MALLRLLAAVVAVASGLTWAPIEGLKTQRATKVAGAGAAVAKGDTVTVHAIGSLKETAFQFWSTRDPGQNPFTYQAGVGKVIPGWDMGLLGAQLGETRLLDIPAEEGYGPRGFEAWKITPNARLLFEIQVLSINGDAAPDL